MEFYCINIIYWTVGLSCVCVCACVFMSVCVRERECVCLWGVGVLVCVSLLLCCFCCCCWCCYLMCVCPVLINKFEYVHIIMEEGDGGVCEFGGEGGSLCVINAWIMHVGYLTWFQEGHKWLRSVHRFNDKPKPAIMAWETVSSTAVFSSLCLLLLLFSPPPPSSATSFFSFFFFQMEEECVCGSGGGDVCVFQDWGLGIRNQVTSSSYSSSPKVLLWF